MSDPTDPMELREIMQAGITKAAAELTEIADRLTDAAIAIAAASGNITDWPIKEPKSLRKAVFSAIAEEIVGRLVQAIANKAGDPT